MLLLVRTRSVNPERVGDVNPEMIGTVIVEVVAMMDGMVAAIDVIKTTRAGIVLKRHETIVASRKRIRLPSKRLLVTLPAAKRVTHLLLPKKM